MPEPFVGEIRMFGGNFAPVGWAFCDGQLIPISQNDVLFTIIGTTYGGDGQETFALPNLQSRVPMHQNANGGFVIGQAAGTESETLTTQQIPVHTHAMVATTTGGAAGTPTNNILAQSPSIKMYSAAAPNTALASTTISPMGGSQPHENMQPFLVISFIISLFGRFPAPQ